MPESNQFSAPLSPSPSSPTLSADPMLPPRLVVTDLDGSLLDHHTYDFSPAAPWLARFKQMGVPVIPVTSKTRAELIPLREALGLTATPFIAENGAVIGLPPGWCHARLDRPGGGRDGVVIKHPGVDIGFIRARLKVWRAATVERQRRSLGNVSCCLGRGRPAAYPRRAFLACDGARSR